MLLHKPRIIKFRIIFSTDDYSNRKCFTFRVIIVILGTVASAKAYRSLAPCRMMPPYSCAVPGKNPGTSTNVIIGMLKASQKRTNLAPFTDASISRQPAKELPITNSRFYYSYWITSRDLGLVCNNANRTTIHACETHNNILSRCWHNFKEFSFIHN